MIQQTNYRSRIGSIISDLIVSLFVFLFIYAASSKLNEYSKFEIQIGQSPLIERFANWLVWLVPVVEFGIVFMLLWGRTRLLALYLSTSLMILFSGYVAYVMRVSSYVPCSCGGILEQMGWREHLLFNVCFSAIGVVGVLLTERANDRTLNQKELFAIGTGEAENLNQQSRQ